MSSEAISLRPVYDFFNPEITVATNQDGSAFTVAKKILDASIACPPLPRAAATQTINALFAEKNKETEKIQALKKAFCNTGKASNWKDAILHIHHQKIVDQHHVFLNYPNSLKLPLEFSKRSLIKSVEAFCTLFGSTFATDKAQRLNAEGDHLLDAVFGAACYNVKSHFNGFALALGDGAGGHFGDAEQDRRVARASHFGTKSCVRLFSAYETPEELKQNLISLLPVINQEVRQKALGESSTLIGCRAFPTADGYRIVGFNIGDNMLVAWHPPTKQGYLLLSSHVTEAGTALVPSAYRSFEVQILDTLIPHDSLLFLMSDGVHDSLPHTEEEKSYPNGLKYRIRTLTTLKTILGEIPEDAPQEDYLQALGQACLEGAEQSRKEIKEENIQIGDDFSILQCHLSKPKPSTKPSWLCWMS